MHTKIASWSKTRQKQPSRLLDFSYLREHNRQVVSTLRELRRWLAANRRTCRQNECPAEKCGFTTPSLHKTTTNSKVLKKMRHDEKSQSKNKLLGARNAIRFETISNNVETFLSEAHFELTVTHHTHLFLLL